jgi:polysaccharide pyruvyl transferase WcaK-like protein
LPTLAFINTGVGRNLGDRAMLMSMMNFARSCGARDLRASEDFPIVLREEFGVRGYPLVFHCMGRFQGLQRLPGGGLFALVLVLVLSGILVLIRRTLGRKLPWTFMEAEMVNTLASADGVVLNGGGYLTDVGRLECRGCLATAMVAQMLGTPVLMTGQGLGPFSSRLTLVMLGVVARRARFVSVRDGADSLAWLTKVGVPQGRAHALGDDAFLLATQDYEKPRRPKRLAVHVRRSTLLATDESVRAELGRLVHYYRAAGWEIRYMIFSEKVDEELAQLSGIDPAIDFAVDVVSSKDPRVVCSAVSECALAIGFAYHFVVFALCQGVPVRALFSGDYYKQKMFGLLRWFGSEHWAVPASGFRAGEVVDSFALDLQSQAEIAKTLRSRAVELTGQQISAYRRAFC